MARKQSTTKPTVVADASSLILLTKSSLLDSLLTRVHIIVPPSVYEEAVLKGKTRGHADALQLELHFQAHHLQTLHPRPSRQQTIQTLFGLRGGERDVIALAQDLGLDTVLMDDKRGITACKALGLHSATALDVLVELRRERIINRDKAWQAFHQLERYGWYSSALLEQARGDLHAR